MTRFISYAGCTCAETGIDRNTIQVNGQTLNSPLNVPDSRRLLYLNGALDYSAKRDPVLFHDGLLSTEVVRTLANSTQNVTVNSFTVSTNASNGSMALIVVNGLPP